MALILYHQSCIMYCKTKVKWMQPYDIFSLFRSNQIKSEGGASDLLYFQYNLAKSAKLNSSTSSALSIGSLKNCKGCFFGENGTFVKSWSKTTVIISHLESSSRDISVRRSYFSNRYPGQVFVKVRGAQKQMPTSCCTIRWYCILLQRSHCHINWFCGDMKYHFDIKLCIFQVQPIWDIFLPSIGYYKTIWVIFLLYAMHIMHWFL